MTGFSPRNLQYVRKFASAWTAETPISQQAAGKLAWGHNMVLLDKLDETEARAWHVAAVKNGWSRNGPENGTRVLRDPDPITVLLWNALTLPSTIGSQENTLAPARDRSAAAMFESPRSQMLIFVVGDQALARS